MIGAVDDGPVRRYLARMVLLGVGLVACGGAALAESAATSGRDAPVWGRIAVGLGLTGAAFAAWGVGWARALRRTSTSPRPPIPMRASAFTYRIIRATGTLGPLRVTRRALALWSPADPLDRPPRYCVTLLRGQPDVPDGTAVEVIGQLQLRRMVVVRAPSGVLWPSGLIQSGEAWRLRRGRQQESR
jgi:hypothetical protein